MKTRWQDQAACKGRDVDLFHPYDQADFPDLKGPMIARFSKAKLEYAARQYCTGCLVRDECNQDAIDHGLHTQGLYGGITPWNRGLKVGSVAPSTIDFHEAINDEVAWRAFVEGYSMVDVRRKIGERMERSEMPKRIANVVATFDPEALTASWSAYHKGTPFTGRQVEHRAGDGWILSVDRTRTVALVLLNASKRKRVYHLLRMITVSEDVDIKALPYLQEYPESYDYL